jgi:hypothetical protein
VVGLSRGGALEEYTIFSTGVNYAGTLTRRLESYHQLALQRGTGEAGHGDGTASIHDIEAGIRLDARPPVDQEDRALLVDRVLPADLAPETWARGEYRALTSWAAARAEHSVRRRRGGLEVTLSLGSGRERLVKILRFEQTGAVAARYHWEQEVAGPEDLFAVELSVFGLLRPEPDPEAGWWRFPIETVAKSERGLDRTRQGESITLRWPVRLGSASVTLPR